MPGIRRLEELENGERNAGGDGSSSSSAAVIYSVPGGLRDPGRLWVSWSNGNQLQLSYIENAVAGGGRVTEIHLGEGWDAERRRLAYDSLPAFALLQNQRQLGYNPGDWWEHVLEYSKSIRSVLDQPTQGKTSMLKAVWELIEVFYVDRSATWWLPERLVDWLAEYDKVLLSDEDTVHSKVASFQRKLSEIQFPEDDVAYWDAMASALSVGWLDVVIAFLRMHGSYRLDQLDDRQTENGLVEAVTLLIMQMPRLRPRLPDGSPGVAIGFKPDFSKAREKWRSQVSKLENSVFWAECNHRGTLLGLKKLIQVLLGNVDVLQLSTFHWMELLVAHFLHLIPFSLVLDGMRSIASKCKGLKSFGDEDLQELLSAIISNDTEILLAKCSKVFNAWMMAHVDDLLIAKGEDVRSLLEEDRQTLGGLSLKELHRLVYSQVLSSHSLTWQLAPVYLAACPNRGLGMLEALLMKQSCSNQKLALKALEICRLYELDTVSTAIARAVGVHSLKHGKKGQGIMWLQLARDEQRLSTLADQILNTITSGEADSLDNLEHFEGLCDILGSGATKHQGLSFLARYKSFKAALQNIRDLRRREASYTENLAALGRAAVTSLLQLLKSGTFPRKFWLSLLQESVELLEWPEQVLVSESETNTLLCCLQELFLARDRLEDDILSTAEPGAVDRLRLALASNLCRAILQS
ncbi:nuclear pore complex protein NUP85 isoform X2 [Selaginella moellendorffii]|uniref:nuclear pore complex protein NUP85 isoform X2 n=1 Tax=Selaginella moellendorffii TaxID=88036 RepID=UPI000D1C31A4|nr:nuclear pore complex protein NUP85 isoform X2 [Selaginella moellendorffii]|eukprot:XP_024537188.1 nuclear pore complex protein NUP85 isoform X2 [Selaginella moellendorffii]